MRRLTCLLLTLLLIFPLCQACAAPAYQRYTQVYFDLFDSVITVIGYADSKQTFDSVSAQALERFTFLHRLFDKYNEYEGINNLYVVNRDACVAPVKVDKELFDLLTFVKQEQPKLHGSINIAMGAVLSIWHDYRELADGSPENAQLPPMDSLVEAAKHQSMDTVILDADNSTVFFTDPAVQLDLGAVAKGYSTELVAQILDVSAMPSYILNAGGNVRVGQPPLDGRKSWSIGIQDPNADYAEQNLDVIMASGVSVVTSGDYQRFYMVDGVRYAHIISPDTLMPADNNRSVTVVHPDSGLCDLLSTALFVLDAETGKEMLAQQYPDVGAYWVTKDGEITYTDNLRDRLKSSGASDQ